MNPLDPEDTKARDTWLESPSSILGNRCNDKPTLYLLKPFLLRSSKCSLYSPWVGVWLAPHTAENHVKCKWYENGLEKLYYVPFQ